MVVVPARMGRINKRTLLGRLQRMGVASRAELAKSLSMSQPTAGKIADELLELGVLEEVNGENGTIRSAGTRTTDASVKLGRPGRMLRLNRSEPRFLAIQLGVSETSLAALPVGVDQEDHWTAQVRTPGSAEDWVKQLRVAAGEIEPQEFWGVLVSVPGIVDEKAGRVLFSPNLHWTEKAALPKVIQHIWSAPVVLVQEERALALGHQYLNPESEDFLLVDFGDGVGGAVVVGGRLYANPLPISGELGHTPVLGNKRPCGCGAVGCVETLVSTRGLLQSHAAAHPQTPKTWSALRSAIMGNGMEPWLTRTLDAVAVVIAGALNVLGLRHVVITGSPAELPPAVMEYLSGGIVRGAMWARFGKVEVESAPRRRAAGLVAMGLDRLVLPMTGAIKPNETIASPAGQVP
jgi:predicted NBD/HSP70 family sugar kinase